MKLMFSVVSVRQSFSPRGVEEGVGVGVKGSRVTITHDVYELTVHPSFPQPHTFSGHQTWWSSLEICSSNLFT